MTEPLKPGQRLLAKVDGKKAFLVFSLETEEKGDNRDHCYRYDRPYFPIVPKDSKVEVIKLRSRRFPKVPSPK